MIDWNEVIEQAHREVRRLNEDEATTMGAAWLFDDEVEDDE